MEKNLISRISIAKSSSLMTSKHCKPPYKVIDIKFKSNVSQHDIKMTIITKISK
jgi:hypothetical protein